MVSSIKREQQQLGNAWLAEPEFLTCQGYYACGLLLTCLAGVLHQDGVSTTAAAALSKASISSGTQPAVLNTPRVLLGQFNAVPWFLCWKTPKGLFPLWTAKRCLMTIQEMPMGRS